LFRESGLSLSGTRELQILRIAHPAGRIKVIFFILSVRVYINGSKPFVFVKEGETFWLIVETGADKFLPPSDETWS